MKKIFALLPLVAVLGLTGCGKDKEGDGDNSEGENIAVLEKNEAEVEAKISELAVEGLEISFEAKEEGEEAESTTTAGMKAGYLWIYSGTSKSMYYVTENSVLDFTYNTDEQIFERADEPLPLEVDAATYTKALTATFAYNFTYANKYDALSGFTKVKETTYLNRPATEYKYHRNVSGLAVVDYDLIVDKETGITLYWMIHGADYTGESGGASYEVKTFKTGADVTVPNHN